MIYIGTRSIDITKDIALVQVGSTQEILAINEVACSTDHGQGRLGIRIYHIDRNQRSHTVRTEGTSQLPILITIVGRLRAIIGSIGIDVCTDGFAQLDVHVTSHVKAIGIVILSLTKVQVVACTVITDIGIEARTLVTTFYLCRHLRAIESLLDIIRRIEIYAWVAIRVLSRCIIVDTFRAVWKVVWITAIIQESLIVKTHVLSRTEILRISLGNIPSGIGIHLYLQAIAYSTTLGGNHDYTIGSTAAIKHRSLCTLEERDALYLGRGYVACLTWHTINEDKCVRISPHAVAIVT